MSEAIPRIINAIPGIEDMRYLELGVGKQATFNAVRAGYKVGVEAPWGNVEGFRVEVGAGIRKLSTDEFFSQYPDPVPPQLQFEVVFIDADHSYLQTLRDYNNAVSCCPDGVIFLHDMVPPEAKFATPQFCGDSFKLLYGLLMRGRRRHLKVLDDGGASMGFTAVLQPRPILDPDPSWGDLTYEEFFRIGVEMEQLPLVSEKQMIKALQ